MPTKGLVFVLALVLCFSFTHPPSQAAYSYSEPIIQVVSSVSFREGPSTSNDRIRYLHTGEQLLILSTPNGYWYEAKDANGVTGFLSSSSRYIQLTTRLVFPEPNGEIVSSVSFRSGPSTSNSRIRYLAKGELIWILEKVNDYWYKAEDNNNVAGYLSTSSKFINTTFTNSTEGESANPENPDPSNAQVIKSVSFRTGPSTSDQRIRYLQAGEPLWISSKFNSYWYEAQDQNGITGYVTTISSYIDTDFVEERVVIDPNVAAELIITAGMGYLGTPYEFGSSRYDTSTFDCSDFIRQIFLDGIGLKLPSDSRQQAEWVKQNVEGEIITDWQRLKRGDLMFFMSYKGYGAGAYSSIDKTTEEVTHVGIYLGNGQVLHTYSTEAGGVVISDVQGTNWDNRFLFGGQALLK